MVTGFAGLAAGALACALVQCQWGGTTPVRAQDVMAYSYICLESQQDLCIGISPGSVEPTWDPADVYYVQVKSRQRNEYTNSASVLFVASYS